MSTATEQFILFELPDNFYSTSSIVDVRCVGKGIHLTQTFLSEAEHQELLKPSIQTPTTVRTFQGYTMHTAYWNDIGSFPTPIDLFREMGSNRDYTELPTRFVITVSIYKSTTSVRISLLT